ncbi:uncharacterized protein LOC9662517 [Selaginella moellendorffii]|uniref:uncharacterized protein LOC9662517 n=1 Tax=Selaginella moellendorffii TaxID=88036 RepID=UPI000D1C82D6|nr:uncharacterized protein LOC9659902 isoform X2 [Selaginella moellendorffii]XP_024537963.1 uncharacterized protein LOC9662517 [Selaginella moellendorffii]|eukprot:XP_024525332.1 uncharacterized protein LOC9659902 isoform X2 [Selaginella moellendorffii]
MKAHSRPAGNALFVFHLVAFLWFLYTFSWHFGRAASKLPQSQGFGWFFKYLTFCGFTLQLVSLLVCLLSHLFPESRGLKRAADDLSCTTFAIANVITAMHWVLYFTTAAPVEASATAKIETTVTRSLNVQTSSPLWLNLTVHLANAIVAWTDVHVSDRTFRKSSLNQSLIFCLVYTTWIQVCAFKNKMYPYPFLNKLPQPEGFIATVAVAVTLTFAFFKAGSTLASVQTSRRLAKLKAM